jgi:hypothetical protein
MLSARWAEAVAAFHRKFREGSIKLKELGDCLISFNLTARQEHLIGYAFAAVIERLVRVYASLPAGVHLVLPMQCISVPRKMLSKASILTTSVFGRFKLFRPERDECH